MSDNILDDILSQRENIEVPPREDVLKPTAKPDTTIEKLEAEVMSFPELGPIRNIRLEMDIHNELLTICQTNRITIDTLIETFYLHHKDKSAFQKILNEAKKRNEIRQERGRKRRLLSTLKK